MNLTYTNLPQVAEEVAAIIMRFKDVEHNVAETTAQTLRLTSAPLDDTTHVNQYTALLDTLGKHLDDDW